jgi:pyruvate kinase
MIVWHSNGMKEQNMKTEIFGTLGPSCSDTKTLKRMFENGMTGMRLNLSHTSLRESEEILSHFHEAAAESGVKADLLIDMQGPELRVGHFSGERLLKEGDCVILTEEADDLSDVPAGAQALPVPDGFLRHLDDGNEILLDDGKERETVLLDKPYEGLYVSNVLWREMYDFSSDAVLMVLASDFYDETDYIRNYQDFLDFVNSKENV